MWNFIWLFTVCQSAGLGVSGLKGLNEVILNNIMWRHEER